MNCSCVTARFVVGGVAPSAAWSSSGTIASQLPPSCRLFCYPVAVSGAACLLFSRPLCRPFGCQPSAAALLTNCRHQRSTSARPHTSTWQEKISKVEAHQRDQQSEAARAAQRRARYASGAAAPTDASVLSAVSFSKSSPMAAPLTRPPGGFWGFIRGGDKGRKTQPLNPLMYLDRWREASRHDPEARAAQRLLLAINALSKRNSRRREPMTVCLSDKQKQEIVNRYASTRWYARLYAPFQNWTEQHVRWTIRFCNLVLAALTVCSLVVILAAYFKEMDAVAHLSPEDQRDYAYMVRGMRYSDIYKLGVEVLKKEDPLEALPPEVRLHMVIEACRQKRWHELNWDVELRKMHPGSPLEELDYMHCIYWGILQIGALISSGGVLFSDRVLDLREARHGNAESTEERDRFVEMEPTSLPTRTQRSFF
ncbi:hypothetical protein LSCM1_06781 [Leishmania martiniquensis]|uniref:Transmembrane protein n=1 Tax=Leishmania martiniquensis TaxID=1580590 RepID=A0A836KNP5_9TRYP|nr:hypothetical protein LSCM1_06781 [Leishmania martiniquensis]